jgi:hypothetical protein
LTFATRIGVVKRQAAVVVITAVLAGAGLAGHGGASPSVSATAPGAGGVLAPMRGPAAFRALQPAGMAQLRVQKASRPGGVDRVHQGCVFPPGVAAPAGNWTHGHYVSAWDSAGPARVTEAAHSRCGKPIHSGGKPKVHGDGQARVGGEGAKHPSAEKLPRP